MMFLQMDVQECQGSLFPVFREKDAETVQCRQGHNQNKVQGCLQTLDFELRNDDDNVINWGGRAV